MARDRRRRGGNRPGRPDTDALRSAARGRWRDILPRCGVDARALTGRHGPCPGCGGRDRFRFDDRDGRGGFVCSQGGGDLLAGDGFVLIQHVHGVGFAGAAELVEQALGIRAGTSPPPPARPARASTRTRRTTLAPAERERWERALPIEPGDPAGRYLRERGCALPHPDGDLRWHPQVRHWQAGHVGPALVALLTDPATAEPVTLHATWIAPDGSGKAALGDLPVRLTLPGHSNVGVVRLWPDAEVTTGLALAEGIESALTVAHGFVPVWATTVANNLRAFPVLAGVEALTVIADADPAGLAAATACADRWAAAGREVRLWRSARDGDDANDTWGRTA